jgi:hypothetical protein
MATAQAAPIKISAATSPPGVLGEVPKVQSAQAFPAAPQSGAPYPPSNVQWEFINEEPPTARPSHIRFAAIRDPRLKVKQAIPLDVAKESSTVVVSWAEVDEFGTGDDLGSALDDFGYAVQELYHRLRETQALGPDLKNVKKTLDQYIVFAK